MTAPARLLRAWRLTDYRIDGFVVRIGRRVPTTLFARLGSRSATLMTAWNPMSRRRPNGWNSQMQLRLRQHLRRLSSLEATGRLNQWYEPMLLVGGDPRRIIRIAARFRQLGVVVLRQGRAAQLFLVRQPAASPR
ncbi:MAG TPA: DUF3293 domain-containing protein [Acetobacteraceae bacterium]|nr:DUF3293 domain-containing protein [Acetobacteraceae bacterium]